MLHKLLWLNFINLLKKSQKQELYILLENVKTDHNQKCHSTQQINMLYQLLSNKVLIIIGFVILKELLKKFGNSVEEFLWKENIKLSPKIKKKDLKMLT